MPHNPGEALRLRLLRKDLHLASSLPPDCITLILGDRITVKNASLGLIPFPRSLDPDREPQTPGGTWVLTARDEAAVAHVLEQLRDGGAVFVGGDAGWPPAAIFHDLRDRGLAAGSFNEVVWKAKNEWTVRTR